MEGSETSGARPVVVGANHRSSSLGLRDRLFVEDADVAVFLRGLRDAGLADAILISTCDRVEVHALHLDPAIAVAAVRAGFADRAGGAAGDVAGDVAGGMAGDINDQCYTHVDERAIEHMFAVAASLDSQIIGEPQVLGQLKAAHRLARDAGMVGGELEHLMHAAYGAAKRVRTETAIGERPVSIAAAAVDLARDVHGDLGQGKALLLGIGDMGLMIAEHLVAGGLGYLTLTHPVEARAANMARALDCHRVDFDRRADAMAEADVVITALGRREYALNADMVRAAVKTRRMRPIFLVDVAVPGDIDPAVNRIDAAFVYELGDLERIVSDGRASREAEAEAGHAIIAAEVTAYRDKRAGRAAVPAVKLLRAHAETMRDDVLKEAGDDAGKATRLLINRLLHDPSVNLRHAASGAPGELETLDRALRKLFQLQDMPSHGAGGDKDEEP